MQYELINQDGNILRIIEWYEDPPPPTPFDNTVQWVTIEIITEPVVTEHQTAIKTGIIQNESGQWVYRWEIHDWTTDEITANTTKVNLQRQIDDLNNQILSLKTELNQL